MKEKEKASKQKRHIRGGEGEDEYDDDDFEKDEAEGEAEPEADKYEDDFEEPDARDEIIDEIINLAVDIISENKEIAINIMENSESNLNFSVSIEDFKRKIYNLEDLKYFVQENSREDLTDLIDDINTQLTEGNSNITEKDKEKFVRFTDLMGKIQNGGGTKAIDQYDEKELTEIYVGFAQYLLTILRNKGYNTSDILQVHNVDNNIVKVYGQDRLLLSEEDQLNKLNDLIKSSIRKYDTEKSKQKNLKILLAENFNNIIQTYIMIITRNTDVKQYKCKKPGIIFKNNSNPLCDTLFNYIYNDAGIKEIFNNIKLDFFKIPDLGKLSKMRNIYDKMTYLSYMNSKYKKFKENYSEHIKKIYTDLFLHIYRDGDKVLSTIGNGMNNFVFNNSSAPTDVDTDRNFIYFAKELIDDIELLKTYAEVMQMSDKIKKNVTTVLFIPTAIVLLTKIPKDKIEALLKEVLKQTEIQKDMTDDEKQKFESDVKKLVNQAHNTEIAQVGLTVASIIGTAVILSLVPTGGLSVLIPLAIVFMALVIRNTNFTKYLVNPVHGSKVASKEMKELGTALFEDFKNILRKPDPNQSS
jgi:hypothetical protein